MLRIDGEIGVTQRVLDAMAIRGRAILHNVANQNTPGYKAYRVRFEDQLRAALETGRDGGHVHASVERDDSGPPGANNVSVMDELALLDKVRLVQDLFARRASSYFDRLNQAITGRVS